MGEHMLVAEAISVLNLHLNRSVEAKAWCQKIIAISPILVMPTLSPCAVVGGFTSLSKRLKGVE
jgi:hypothetical protein